MKVAIAGKGGAGKTTIAGTMSRLLARQGHPVLAVDGDSNPNLGLSLGFGLDTTEALLAAREELEADDATHETSAEGIVARFGADGPDGVRVVQVSRIDSPLLGCP